jgi:hypothetical protein
VPETATTTCPKCGVRLVTDGFSRGMPLLCSACQFRFRLTSGAHPVAHVTTFEAEYEEFTLPYILPVGRSGWAIAAGYLGLFSLLPFLGAVFGILAVIAALLAERDIKRNPGQRGRVRAIFGLVLGSLSLIGHGIFVIGLMAAQRPSPGSLQHDPFAVPMLAVGFIMSLAAWRKKNWVFVVIGILLSGIGVWRTVYDMAFHW